MKWDIDNNNWEKEFLTIDKKFQIIAKKYPDKIALIDWGNHYSYKKINEDSDRLAVILQKQWIMSGDRVGVYLEKGYFYIVSCLAVLKCKCSYVHVDILYDTKKIEYILWDSFPKILLTEAHLLRKIKTSPLNTYCLDEYLDWQDANLSSFPSIKSDISNLETAIIWYTSGSTWIPKGVKVSHRAALYAFEKFWWEIRDIEENNKNRFWYLTYLAWDALSPLLIGATWITVPRDVINEIEKLLLFIQEQRINHIFVTPTLLKEMFRFIEKDQDKFTLENVYVVWIWWEKVDVKIIEEFRNFCPKGILINNYWPTEFWVVSQGRLDAKNLKKYRENGVSAGYVLPEVKYKLLHYWENSEATSEAGLLYVAGPTIANWYLDKDLTNKKFITIHEDVYFATWDICRIINNRELVLLWREEFLDIEEIPAQLLLNLENFIREITEIQDFLFFFSKEKNSLFLIYTRKTTKNNISNAYLENLIEDALQISVICIQTSRIPLNYATKKADYISLLKLIHNDSWEEF